jgi:phosphatidylglycerol lysyltransferase
LTVALLAAGVVFSLLKGLDYEEAIILSVMLAALSPCHHQFYRKASLISQRFTLRWVALVAAALLCSVWLGLFSYKHISYSHQLWWEFAVHGDAPRFLRASLGAIVLVFLYAVARLLVPARPGPKVLDRSVLETVHAIVSNSKRTHPNLALLGDKEFILSQKRNAFIMYSVERRTWVALGDPVGNEDDWEELAWQFVELCDQYDGWPVFYQVEAVHLDLYANLGMSFLKLGEEARVELQSFSLEGHPRRGLRQAHNKIGKENYTFEIVPPEEVPQILAALEGVSNIWLSQKNTNEKGFSLGFFSPDYIRQFPAAVVRKDQQIVAFANIWMGAEKEELSVDLMRYLPNCPDGMMDYLFVELLLWGKSQSYKWFNFGMAPLSGLEGRALASLWSRAGVFVFRHGEHFYNFRGLREYKDKFDPLWQPRYLAYPSGLALPQILTSIVTLISGGAKGVVMK